MGFRQTRVGGLAIKRDDHSSSHLLQVDVRYGVKRIRLQQMHWMIRLQIGGDWHWRIYSIVGFGNLSQASALLCIRAGSKGSIPHVPEMEKNKRTACTSTR